MLNKCMHTFGDNNGFFIIFLKTHYTFKSNPAWMIILNIFFLLDYLSNLIIVFIELTITIMLDHNTFVHNVNDQRSKAENQYKTNVQKRSQNGLFCERNVV